MKEANAGVEGAGQCDALGAAKIAAQQAAADYHGRPRREGPGRSDRIMDDQNEIRRKLEELRSEHRDLDAVIARVAESAPFDQIQLQRLKKRKLVLKDRIARLESRLLPDIIA